jgi:4-oxalocrotonate tautomerase
MPHITIQMYPGRDDETKQKLADALVKTASEELKRGAEHFSVSIEDIPQEEWKEKVYKAAIDPENKNVYVRPGY